MISLKIVNDERQSVSISSDEACTVVIDTIPGKKDTNIVNVYATSNRDLCGPDTYVGKYDGGLPPNDGWTYNEGYTYKNKPVTN